MLRTETLRDIMRKRARERPRRPDATHWRPAVRADCAKVPRPCPYVGCRYNLTLDVTGAGSIIYRRDIDWAAAEPQENNCALDIAELGGINYPQLAIALRCTKQHVQHQTSVALEKVKKAFNKDSK